MANNLTDSWRTPDWLYKALDTEFGFDFDPCPFQPDWTPGIHEDGLALDWNGRRIYCNPPFSDIQRWIEKAYGRAALTVFLLPSRTDTLWFQLLRDRGAEIRFLRKRIHFVPPPGVKSSSPSFGCIVAIVRPFLFPQPATQVAEVMDEELGELSTVMESGTL